MAKTPYVNPTVTYTPLKMDSGTHQLCFTFGALATAESLLRKAGHPDVNLLRSFDFSSLGASDIAPLLYAAMLSHRPKVAYDEVVSWISLENIGSIVEALLQAYVLSLAEPEKNVEGGPEVVLEVVEVKQPS